MSATDEVKDFELAFFSCITIVGIFTNGFIILIFALRRKLRSVTNYFVVNLAVSDFFLSLQLILYLLFSRFSNQIQIPPKITYNILSSFLTLGMSASPASLVMVSFDRYFAISEPLRYNSFFTHRRAIFMIVGIWFYATIMYLLNWAQLAFTTGSFFYQKVFVILLAVGNFVIPLCAVTFFYCHILKIALSHLRSTPRNLDDANSELSLRRKQFQIARNVCTLIFPLLVIWSTYYIFQLRYSYCHDCISEPPDIEDVILETLPHLVSAINPITYILLTKDFRVIITSKCGECTSRTRANSEFGLQTDNLPLTAISCNDQNHGTYKVSSM